MSFVIFNIPQLHHELSSWHPVLCFRHEIIHSFQQFLRHIGQLLCLETMVCPIYKKKKLMVKILSTDRHQISSFVWVSTWKTRMSRRKKRAKRRSSLAGISPGGKSKTLNLVTLDFAFTTDILDSASRAERERERERKSIVSRN